MSLPKTVHEVVERWHAQAAEQIADLQRTCPDVMIPTTVEDINFDAIVRSVLVLVCIKVDDDGQTLIYPSTVGTNTPRYQVEESRHARWKGRR